MSLDACHLKGEIGGQLLCAIGKYGNDDMIPIAYAVAEAETKASWEWFIGLLVDDVYVGSGEGCGWTIMSDRQKVMFTIFPVSFLLLLLLLLLLFFFFFFLIFIVLLVFRTLLIELFAYVQGLGPAVDHLLPHAEHRFCVRHLHANFKTNGYEGKAFKDELWGATRASNATIFQHHMKVIQGMDADAYRYLNDINHAS